MIKLRVLLAFAAFSIGAFAMPASADSIPGLRGHDHTGITVPDVKAATAFFTDVLGCKHAMSFGPFMDDKGTFMQDVVNVHPRAVIEEISMVRCGYGSNIELFQYKSPDQAKTEPKNSDYGGHHIALYVDDIAKAAEYLHSRRANVVGIDPRFAWYAADLIRNDPFLEDRPVVVALVGLTPTEVAALARAGQAQFVSREEMQEFGLSTTPRDPRWHDPLRLAYGP